jgi:prophage regulatory protein
MQDQAWVMKMKLLSYNDLKPRRGIDYTRDRLRAKVKAGEFPAPISLSEGRIAWIEQEIDAWIEQRAALRKTKQAA